MSLANLPEIVLGPLRGRPDADWQRAPAGKWTPAQIVEHLALGIGWSAEKFRARQGHAPMAARPRRPAETIARMLILGLRWFPPGRKAPEKSVPAPAMSRAAAEGHFLAAIAAWEQIVKELLPQRRGDLYVKHPRLGDLSMEEWMRFHTIHARHHARQIKQRLAG